MKKGYIIIGSNETDRTILAKQFLKDKRYLHVGGPESVDVQMITEQTSFVESDRPAFNFLLINDLKSATKLKQLVSGLPNEYRVNNLKGLWMYNVTTKNVFTCELKGLDYVLFDHNAPWLEGYSVIDTNLNSVQSIIQFTQEKR
ncbi:hypothetical protein [Sphingobacterium sp. UGAL515B_05]|uniref:hypothetical protein n=1 Tax=Sphingobacterium sp. UGAL515B_05 TaxID=2986767 RepID=UPI0029559288|nr:hypothetical protein [Sphingobacterium sp. UGAL515B_05]WON93870.1 hypothetical protein OK025_21795 [Sphingobacterium sp. UGAL515B_05]